MLAITNADIQQVATILEIVGGILIVAGLGWGIYRKFNPKK